MTIQKIPKIPHIPISITSHWNFLVHGTINYIFSFHAMTKIPIVKNKTILALLLMFCQQIFKNFVQHHHIHVDINTLYYYIGDN
jgi:hypothetical protein